MQESRLRLFAEDEEDLSVISATLQDCVLTVADMAFLPKRRRFALVLNRFRWEKLASGARHRTAERVRSGLHFDGVLKVDSQHINRDPPDAVISLLAVMFEPSTDGPSTDGPSTDGPVAQGAGVIRLVFAGGGAIRLHVECIDAVLEDLSEPWPARGVPSHSKVDPA